MSVLSRHCLWCTSRISLTHQEIARMNVFRVMARIGAAASVLGVGVLLLGTAATTSIAARPSPGYTLFGYAALIHPGENSPTAVQLVWSPSQPFGGVDYAIPAGLSVSQLNTLS